MSVRGTEDGCEFLTPDTREWLPAKAWPVAIPLSRIEVHRNDDAPWRCVAGLVFSLQEAGIEVSVEGNSIFDGGS